MAPYSFGFPILVFLLFQPTIPFIPLLQVLQLLVQVFCGCDMISRALIVSPIIAYYSTLSFIKTNKIAKAGTHGLYSALVGSSRLVRVSPESKGRLGQETDQRL